MAVLVVGVCLGIGHGAVAAESCTAEAFAIAVDGAGASLRQFNAEAQPLFKGGLKALKDRKGWPEEGYEDRGLEYLQDGRLATYDEQSNELLTKIDTLGRIEDGTVPDCAKLADLKAASVELLAVMKAKSAYMLEKIEKETGPGSVAAAVSPPSAPSTPAKTGSKPDTASPAVTPQVATEPKPAVPPPAKPQPAAEAKAIAIPPGKSAEKSGSWQATTAMSPPAAPPAAEPGEPYTAAPPPAMTPAEDEGYTIDEIREATRGVFGTISTSLASVIEHAFSSYGRPTAYVVGSEGGGAFLAGLRYGSGTMVLRFGGQQKVYWHGPSLGTDLGADGGRTLFLVYKLKEPGGLFRQFTGVNGSAYLVGGVGMTLLKGGDVIMAPIRSGLGLRLGANIGYLRFTPRPTWNPF